MQSTYTLGPASCRVRTTMAVPEAMRAGTRELSKLHVTAAEQGKGYATSLVHAVCRDADAEGIVLLLWPQPFGDDIALSRAQLEAWYERSFGFVRIQPSPVLMARAAVVRPRVLKLVSMAASAAFLKRAA